MLVRSVIEAISDPKRTGLGTGRFVTTRLDFVAVPDADVPAWARCRPSEVQALFDAGEPVATMRFRILKYPARRTPASTPPRPPRPRPALTQDNAFWFEGARAHRLLDSALHVVRHAAPPAAARLRDLRVARVGHGRSRAAAAPCTPTSSCTIPQVPSFEYPLPIGLVELEEGTRVVANLGGVELDDIAIGMAAAGRFVDYDEELSLPVFVPAGGATAERRA